MILLEGATEVVPAALFASSRTAAGWSACSAAGPPARPCSIAAVGGEVSGRPVFDAAAPLLPGFAKPPAFVF